MLGFDEEQVANAIFAKAGEMPIARQSYYLADNWAEKDFSWGHLARTGLVDAATLAALPVGGVGSAGRLMASGAIRSGVTGGMSGFAGSVGSGEGLRGAAYGAVFGAAGSRYRGSSILGGFAAGSASVAAVQLDVGGLDARGIFIGGAGGAAGAGVGLATRMGGANVGAYGLGQAAFSTKAIVVAEMPFVALGASLDR